MGQAAQTSGDTRLCGESTKVDDIFLFLHDALQTNLLMAGDQKAN